MHRQILLSRTYQMASGLSEAALAKDPNNELLGAFPRRRLDAESIRDTLLVLGQTLETIAPGPHPFPPQTEWKFTQHNPFKAVYDTRQRSVYLMTQRIQRPAGESGTGGLAGRGPGLVRMNEFVYLD